MRPTVCSQDVRRMRRMRDVSGMRRRRRTRAQAPHRAGPSRVDSGAAPRARASAPPAPRRGALKRPNLCWHFELALPGATAARAR